MVGMVTALLMTSQGAADVVNADVSPRLHDVTLRVCAQDGASFGGAAVSVRLIEPGFRWGVCVGMAGDVDSVSAQATHLVADADAEGQALDDVVRAGLLRGALVQASLPLDPEAARQRMLRYAGQVKAWEVAHGPFGDDLEAVCKRFRVARTADPDARLLLSDQALGDPTRCEALAAFARECLESDAPLEGLAVSASDGFDWGDAQALERDVALLLEAEAPVYLTGLDAEAVDAWLPVVLRHPNVAGVACRGSLSSLESCAQRVNRALALDLTEKTDKRGKVSFRGPEGDYEIVLDGHVWKIRVAGDGPHSFELRKPPTVEPPDRFELPFTATTEDDAWAWQDAVRKRLFEIVSAQNPRNDHALDVQLGEAEDRGAYTARDLTFMGNEGTRIETTLTVPKGERPFPALVTLHGHGGNRARVHDATTEYNGFAAEYAKRGVVTLSPSLDHYDFAPNQLWNLMRLVDVLETLDYVDPGRIGVAGLSMGGEWTMWLAAMDARIKAAVVSGWMCTTEGVLSIHNCPCWMPPGLLELCDIAEVHTLIAPRPLLFQSAIGDGCFPIRCTEEGYRKIVRGYDAFDAALNVRQHTFPGGHAWNGGIAYEFMVNALRP
ncbi:MAG: hypothetical protein GY851_11450 [bacterium]|nr:hypothetical protein [bacterium]